MKIAVIGAGFVGSAVAAGFQKSNPIVVDPKLGYTVEDLVKEHQDLGAAFICVPTPMGENGSIDCSIVMVVLILDLILVFQHLVWYNYILQYLYILH